MLNFSNSRPTSALTHSLAEMKRADSAEKSKWSKTNLPFDRLQLLFYGKKKTFQVNFSVIFAGRSLRMRSSLSSLRKERTFLIKPLQTKRRKKMTKILLVHAGTSAV